MKGLTRIRALTAFASLLHLAPRLAAQTDTVQSARALKDSARFTEAIALLRPYTAAHPTNGDAARLLSLLLYWTHDVPGSRAIADSSLALHPEDTALRLQYGTMLAEIGDSRRATAVLTPLFESPERGRALGILGTIAYWRGDLTKARELFTESLHDQPNQLDIRRQLGFILDATAPWTSVEIATRHDDQHITSSAMSADAGWFPTPLVRVTAHAEPMIFAVSDSGTRESSTGELRLSGYLPDARLDIELGAGGLYRSFGSRTDWIGRAALSARLPSHVTAGLRAERAPYTYTVASLSTPIMTNTATAALRLDSPRGWLGEAALAMQRFPDENDVRSAYLWTLAPLVHRSRGVFQLGYSAAWQNAAQSRFVLARPVQPVPVASAQFDFSGRYVPYYTPLNSISHSVLSAGSIQLSGSTTLRANASYGVHAADDATNFAAGSPPSSVSSTVTRRTFTPWNVGTGVDVASGSALAIGADGQVAHTAFYTAVTAAVRLTFKFGRGERRDVAGF